MRILVTAGNTQTPIDRVRCLTNIFTGRTGARLALAAAERWHAVTILTSHPETISSSANIEVRPYRTFDDLHELMAEVIPPGNFDAILHSAAVSDYALAGVFGSQTSPPNSLSEAERGNKLSSKHSELWMKFTPTPKLVDFIRRPWNFRGTLVKFKLEVGIDTEELLAIGRRSRADSDADFIVANILESYRTDAWLIDRADTAVAVARADLPWVLMDAVEKVGSRATHH